MGQIVAADVGDLVILEVGGGKVAPLVFLGKFGRMGFALGVCLGVVRKAEIDTNWRPASVCPIPIFAEPKPGRAWQIIRMGKGLERLFRAPLAYFPEREWSKGSKGFGCVEDVHGVVRAASQEEMQDFLAWHPAGAPNGYFLEDDLKEFMVGLNRKAESRH